MKSEIVRVLAIALMAFSFLAVSCTRQNDDDEAGMAVVLGRGSLIVVTEMSDSNFTVHYCKLGSKTFGVVGDDPMFDGERFEFSDENYTYLGDHGVTFTDKPAPVVMPIYAQKGSTHYYLYLDLIGNIEE